MAPSRAGSVDMRITGLRRLMTFHDWGRPVGDANGVFTTGVTPVPIVLVDTDEGVTGVGLVRDVLAGAHAGQAGLMLDANESWTRKQAVRHVAELERTFDLTWIEEPVRRWDAEGLAAVGRGIRASVATGENLTGLEQFRPLLAAGAVDIVQTASIWGVTHFLRVAALAHAHDLPVSPVGTTPIGLVHAATAVPNHLVTELQDLTPPVGLTVDLHIEDGGYVL